MQLCCSPVVLTPLIVFMNVGAVSVISGLALFIGKVWVMTIAGIGGYYYMQGQYDDKVMSLTTHHRNCKNHFLA